MVPVRRSGGIMLSSRAQPMGSSDFARQLLYSAGFEDIQAVQLTALQGFSQTLPGDSCVPKSAVHSQTEQGTSSSQWHWRHVIPDHTSHEAYHGMLKECSIFSGHAGQFSYMHVAH